MRCSAVKGFEFHARLEQVFYGKGTSGPCLISSFVQVRASDSSSVDVQSSTSGAPSGTGRLLIDRRQLLTGAAASVVTFVGCPCPICKPGEAKAAGWNYGGCCNGPSRLEGINLLTFMSSSYASGEAAGPPNWKGVCATGKRQSPINIPLNTSAPKVDAEMGEFDFAYGSFEQSDVLNTGHGTMQVRIDIWTRPQISLRTSSPTKLHSILFIASTRDSASGELSCWKSCLHWEHGARAAAIPFPCSVRARYGWPPLRYGSASGAQEQEHGCVVLWSRLAIASHWWQSWGQATSFE